MVYRYRNLIFEGGGIKCLAYVGALQVLEEKNILDKIKRVGGASGGAIIALVIGLGYNSAEVEEILNKQDFSAFFDNASGIMNNTQYFYNNYGWYKGEAFYTWICQLVENKTGSRKTTFNEIYKNKEKRGFKDIYLMGTNVSTGYSEIFSQEFTPDMPIADAVRISMSIPLVYAAPTFNDSIYVDGGVLNNYPIKIFDKRKYVEKYYRIPDYYRNYNKKQRKKGKKDSYVFNMETLGFRLESKRTIDLYNNDAKPYKKKINSLSEYIISLIQVFMDSQSNEHLHSDDRRRTIYIDALGVKFLQFNLSESDKEKLIKSGRKYTLKYLAKNNKA